MSSFKKKIGLDDDSMKGSPKRKSRRSRDEEKKYLENLPPDMRFFHKFKSIIRKQIRSMINNSTLEKAYKQEKRKLEIDILRTNEKNKVT